MNAYLDGVIGMERSGMLNKNEQEITVRLDFDRFPRDFTCDGANFSPEVSIEGLDTPYLALIVEDPDAANGPFIHWVLYNVPKMDRIPSNVPKRPDLDHPFTGRQGRNSLGKVGYDGPCPPKGQTHRYYFRVFGLTGPIDAPPRSSKEEVEEQIETKIKQRGEAMATYGR